MSKEFKATHTYDGNDTGVFDFKAGDELMFIRPMSAADDGFDEEFAAKNGVFVNEAGDEQFVYYANVEVI